ncbi:nuclear transport factor 2 family protein [Nocardioides sp. cx-169]|uniref:nuclear transport factor 2 family protein n=1 Tax=Nocardioides sp. cx-169 TaxID=2899080 RepID=UPI001E65CD09|nr:nuclear transport factor 2 family protein [Nocardioides sp. cx-169]MCD4533647.1 nuclear transport factor 2 family protein [Nocardioides sp. cx-169]
MTAVRSDISTEGIHATIAAYARHLDAHQPDELVALFCPDGVSEIVGMARFVGRDELRAGYGGMTPAGPQLHLVGNTVVERTGPDTARANSDLALFSRSEDGWGVSLTGHYADVLHHDGEAWRFHERVLTLQM